MSKPSSPRSTLPLRAAFLTLAGSAVVISLPHCTPTPAPAPETTTSAAASAAAAAPKTGTPLNAEKAGSDYLDPAHKDTQATSNLYVVAHPGDVIRWRAESLSDNAVNAAILYKIVPNNPSGTNVLSTPTVAVQVVSVPVPNVNDATTYRVENQTKGNVTASVNSPGSYPYFVYFYIVPRDPNSDQPGAPQYYYWDPTITVTSA